MNIDKNELKSTNKLKSKNFYRDNEMPPKIKNLLKTKMRAKQLQNLNIIKLNRVKQNYTENNIVQTAFSFVKTNNLEFVKTI